MSESTKSTAADRRLALHRAAVQQLQSGRFDIALPADGDDTVGQLGIELVELAGSLARQFREFSELQNLAERVGEGVYFADVLQSVFDGFKGLIPFNRIGCALIDRDQKRLVARWARSDAEQLEIYAGYSQPLAGSSLEQLLKSGEPRILNDLEAYLAEHPDSDATRKIVAEGVRSSLSCPLVAHGLPVGVLFFSSFEKNTYLDAHPNTFQRIARQLSLVLEKSLLYEEVFSLNRRLQSVQRELELQAMHDALTGLPGRRALQARLDDEIARASRARAPVGILMLDIDRLKQVNDAHGQQAGDAVLKAMTPVLQGCIRSFEFAGRWEGEEFLVILGEADQAAVMTVAERIRAAIEVQPFSHGGANFQVTVSIGATSGVPDHPAWTEILMHAAESALYSAKAAGRNCAVFKYA